MTFQSYDASHIDQQRSIELGFQVDAQPKHCYLAAFRAMSFVPHGMYVEGWLIDRNLPVMPFNHGWVHSWSAGRLQIYDPSLVTRSSDQSTDGLVYIPALVYRPQDVLEILDHQPYNARTLPIHDLYPRLHSCRMLHMQAEEYAWELLGNTNAVQMLRGQRSRYYQQVQSQGDV